MASKMDKSPAFLLYTDKFFTGCADMQPETVGIYIRLLCKLWNLPDGLPTDTKKLARFALVSEKLFIKSWDGDLLSEKFILNDKNNFTNERLEIVRGKRLEKSQLAKESAEKRWQKAEVKDDANALRTQSDGIPNAMHIKLSKDKLSKENINKESKKETTPSRKAAKKPKAFIAYEDYLELLKASDLPNSVKNALAAHFKMREANKWKLTDYAAKLIIKTTVDLFKKYAEAETVECVNASIKGLWKDIYGPKIQDKIQLTPQPLGRAERAERNGAR
jgi:uncharacterized protein YdaU (DUF1376 family)